MGLLHRLFVLENLKADIDSNWPECPSPPSLKTPDSYMYTHSGPGSYGFFWKTDELFDIWNCNGYFGETNLDHLTGHL